MIDTYYKRSKTEARCKAWEQSYVKTMAMEVTQNQADVIIATDDDTCNHKLHMYSARLVVSLCFLRVMNTSTVGRI